MLGRHGIPCVVLERRDQALDAGLGINLLGNAVMALGALGLRDGLERLGARSGDTANERARPVAATESGSPRGTAGQPVNGGY